MSAGANDTSIWKPWGLPGRILALATVWAFALTAPWVALLVSLQGGQLPGTRALLGLTVGSVALTFGCGIGIAFTDSPWRRGVGVLILGCAVEALGLFLIADAPGQMVDDHAASIAVAVLLPPVATATALVLAGGLGTGLLLRRLQRRLERS